jgi:hypothetical protein
MLRPAKFLRKLLMVGHRLGLCEFGQVWVRSEKFLVCEHRVSLLKRLVAQLAHGLGLLCSFKRVQAKFILHFDRRELLQRV